MHNQRTEKRILKNNNNNLKRKCNFSENDAITSRKCILAKQYCDNLVDSKLDPKIDIENLNIKTRSQD